MKTLGPSILVLAASLVACSGSGEDGVIATPGIPIASLWNTTLVKMQGGGGPPTMSVEDIAGGVQLKYEAPSAGLVGSTWLYEYTATATAAGVLTFDVSINASHGFAGTLVLQILHNGSVDRILARSTGTRMFSMDFPRATLTLGVGDTWGIGVIDGSIPGPATAEIRVTAP